MADEGYWNNVWRRRMARRRVLHGGAALTGAAFFAAACSSSNNNNANKAAATKTAANPTTPGTTVGQTATAAAAPRAATSGTAAASPAAAGPPPKTGGKILLYTGAGEASDLDIFGTLNQKLHVQGPAVVYSRLIKSKTGPDVPPLAQIAVPDVAESWEQPDDTTYVFHLRHGVKFHDMPPVNGRELVANDIVFSYNKQLNSPAIKSFLGDVKDVTAVDDYTVRIHSNNPGVDFLVDLSDGHNKIVAHEAVELHGDLKNGPTIGTGPWMFKSWTPNQNSVSVKNPNYFIKGRPYADELDYLRIPDVSTAKAAFQTKQVYAYSDVKSVIDGLRKDLPNLNYIEARRWTAELILTKVKDPPTSDVRVRQALSKAVNRQEVIDSIYGGAGWTYAGPSLPALDWMLPDAELKSLLAYDPQGAKQLLAAAGSPTLTFNCEVQNIPGANAQSFELVQAQLKQVGITLNAQVVENEKFISNLAMGNFTGLSYGIQAFTSPTSDLLLRWHTGGSENGPGLSDPQLDSMIEKQATLFKDEAGRRQLLLDIQRRVIQLASYITIATGFSLSLNWPFLRNYSVPTSVWEFDHPEDMWVDL